MAKKNFKHKVTYPNNDNFEDEWLFLDLKTKKYYASGYYDDVSQRYSGEIFDIGIDTDESQNKDKNSNKETPEKKKSGKNLNEKNWNFELWNFKKSIIGEDDIQSLSTDVPNPKDVIVGMTGYLAYGNVDEGEKINFIVGAIANEKKDGKHFIIYPDGEYNSEWLDLDLKKFFLQSICLL